MKTLTSIIFSLGMLAAFDLVGAETWSVGFGSCAEQRKAQPIWQPINASKLDAFVMLGDNIYGDTEDMAVMRERYAELAEKPGFRQIREDVPVLATWDDHDYGANDAGAEFPKKAESREVFLDFWGKGHPQQQYGKEGVYSSWTTGEEGRRVQIILLDTRYFRSALKRGGKKYAPVTGEGVTILGERQWQWLEQQLSQSADLRILASSIQVIPEEHRFEKWANMPDERQRLFELIGKTKANGVVIISGDRHLGELSMLENTAAGYPIYEVTSSSLNKSFGGLPEEVNRHRIASANFGKENFGVLSIDWSQDDPLITLELRDIEGTTVREEEVALSQLQQ